jgi:predicted ATPase
VDYKKRFTAKRAVVRSTGGMENNENSILIQHLTLKNFLSFGSENEGIELKPLNLFIGPNGSGKSNLIEAIRLMRSSPKELREVTRNGGGVDEWIWKGGSTKQVTVEWVVNYKNSTKQIPLRHSLAFCSEHQSFRLNDERVEEIAPRSGEQSDVYFYYRYNKGYPYVNSSGKEGRQLAHDTIEPDLSILAQRRDPERYPELSWLAQNYERIRIYREWAFGRNAVFREPQKADMRNDILAEDFSNLGIFLNRLKTRFPVAKRQILDGLKDLYDGIDDFEVSIEGGTVQVFFTEGDYAIPATRLSDGTLRYLCLLAILCDPEPPPLICIEEPELGLHPDIIPNLAELLQSASKRTQLIVTTHSDILVDAMTETPEVVVVCSKEDGQTFMERLNPSDLKQWLEKYRLGQLWTKGELGGMRW